MTRAKQALRLLLPVLALQVGGCSALGVHTQAADAALDPQVSAQLQEILDTARADKAVQYPGVILRIETPKGTWSGVSGVSNIETRSAIDPAAKFRCGSIIKPFIATVTLQLVEEGVLSLDDRLTDLLPPEITQLFEYRDSITLKMLLNHTSGIGEWVDQLDREAIYRNSRDKVWSARDLLEMAARVGPNFKPGEKWMYNNTEYTLLGLIIDRKTGTSWRENIRQRIFARLQLKNTVLPEPGTMTMPGSYISGYENFGGVVTDATDLDPSMAGAAGGHALVSNTEDLAIFIRALLAGVFFEKPETLTEMLSGVDTGAPPGVPLRRYGLGLARYRVPSGSYAYGHMGGTSGYSTVVLHFPEERITVTAVITAEQGSGAMMGFLLPSLRVVAQYLQAQE